MPYGPFPPTVDLGGGVVAEIIQPWWSGDRSHICFDIRVMPGPTIKVVPASINLASVASQLGVSGEVQSLDWLKLSPVEARVVLTMK